MNKLWSGRGDVTVLKDQSREFQRTSFSMAVYIQPSLFIGETAPMFTCDDGFFNWTLTFFDKPKNFQTDVNEDAKKN